MPGKFRPVANNLAAAAARSGGDVRLLLPLLPLTYLVWASFQYLADAYISWLPISLKAYSWAPGYAAHIAFFVVGSCSIAAFRQFFPSDFGLRWPDGNGYLVPALVIGSFFGPLMLVVDYYPSLLAHSAPPGPYNTAMSNLLPWLAMQGLFVGPSEELVFRSLLLGFALCLWNRQVGSEQYSVSIATVILAGAFSLAHVDSFWHVPFYQALGQQIYVFILGVFYGWLFERSGSLLAPSLAHNAGDFVEWSLCFALQYFRHWM